MPSAQDMAKRALVQILRAQGHAYGVGVTVTRESPPGGVTRAYRAVARKVHPDKPGGRKEDFQKLSAAHDAWADLIKASGSVGWPLQPRGGHTEAHNTHGADRERLVHLITSQTVQSVK